MEREEETTGEAEDRPGETGAEGGSGGSSDTIAGRPEEDDDSPVGDTDQHSDAGA